MRPSHRIDALAKKYILEAEAACAKNNTQLLASDVAIILCRATADYLDEEWQKQPNVMLQ